jgi:hypothetical protein
MKHEINTTEILKIFIILLFCLENNLCMKTKLEPGMHMLSPQNQNLRKKINEVNITIINIKILT